MSCLLYTASIFSCAGGGGEWGYSPPSNGRLEHQDDDDDDYDDLTNVINIYIPPNRGYKKRNAVGSQI